LAGTAGTGGGGVEVVVAADGLLDVTGDEPLRPGVAAMLGPCRVAPQEHPRLSCRAIDVGAPAAGGGVRTDGARSGRVDPAADRLAGRIFAEIATGGADRTVALRGPARWLPAFEPLAPAAPAGRAGEGTRAREAVSSGGGGAAGQDGSGSASGTGWVGAQGDEPGTQLGCVGGGAAGSVPGGEATAGGGVGKRSSGPSAPPTQPAGAWLITGGFGAIGRTLARRLAAAPGARLALVGRTPLPPRERWPEILVSGESGGGAGNDTGGGSGVRAAAADGPVTLDAAAAARIRLVEELEALGAEVLPLAADVADPVAVRRAVAAAGERFGGLDGVVHAAGVAGLDAARPLGELTAAAVDAQLGAKLFGLLHLDRALAEAGLEPAVRLLFSSLSVELGGLGYAAYAAANAAMDALAQRLGQAESGAAGGRWLAVDWDGWRPEAGAAAARVGGEAYELALTPVAGAAAFDRLVGLERGGALGRVVVSTADLGARVERWVRHPGGPAGPGSAAGAAAGPSAADGRSDAGGHPRPDLQNAFIAPGDDTERAVAAVWQRLLGIDRVGVHDNFFELGGTSLLGVQVMAEVNRRFGVEVPTVGLFEGPTVAALAAVVARLHDGDGAAGSTEALDDSEGRGDRRREAARRRAARRSAGGRA
jgi:NAD(P)-dependent dehydrogenase (short-subunit alcohol dehydrogenase family)